MKKFAQDAWASTATNWIIFAELGLNLTIIVTISVVTVLSPVAWANLSTQDKFIIILGISGQCATNMLAWLSKSASKIINRQILSSDTPPPSIEVTSSTKTDTVKVTTPTAQAVEEKEIK